MGIVPEEIIKLMLQFKTAADDLGVVLEEEFKKRQASVKQRSRGKKVKKLKKKK